VDPLLGGKVSLDDIEHEMLRQRGRYDDPRVHFAVNCASIGCPALREEAFVAERLDAQLDEQALRFMSDRTRNRYNAQRGRLELSKIFDWYGEDFRLGHRGIARCRQFLRALRRSAGRCAGRPRAHPRAAGGDRLPRLRLGAQRRAMTPAPVDHRAGARRSRRHRRHAEALAPLRARGAEVIVVDGGSRDGTHALAASAGRPVLAGPRGRARQMNAGAAAARGEVLLFLHADTRLPARPMRSCRRALARGASVLGPLRRAHRRPLHAAAVVAGDDEPALAAHRHRHRRPGDVRAPRRLPRVGGFPDQPLMEDIELSRRLRALVAPACLRARVVTSGRRWERAACGAPSC
jgi:hypothetical protein